MISKSRSVSPELKERMKKLGWRRKISTDILLGKILQTTEFDRVDITIHKYEDYFLLRYVKAYYDSPSAIVSAHGASLVDVVAELYCELREENLI